MQSQANAWAWRDRLSAAHISEVLDRTRDVAERFYTPAELEGRPGVAAAAAEAAARRPALMARDAGDPLDGFRSSRTPVEEVSGEASFRGVAL